MTRRDLLLTGLSAASLPLGSALAASTDPLTAWPGGLPPLSLATPPALEAALTAAMARKRAEVGAILADPAAPTFANTVLALEDSGDDLARLTAILDLFTTTQSDDAVKALESRVRPQFQALDDEVLLDPRLYARIEAVRHALPADPDDRRLVEVTHDRMVRAGAELTPETKQTLTGLNARITELRTQFNRHLADEESTQIVTVTDAARLRGLSERDVKAAKQAAVDLGKPDAWVVHNRRPEVWAVATRAQDRSLRQQVWTQWMRRGQNPGPNDNAAVTSEILTLRGQKAKLFGYASYADYALADRMARTPRIALDALQKTYDAVRPITVARLAEMQALAKAEGADFTIEGWDYLYYEAKLREASFAIDAEQVQAHLQLDKMIEAMMWSAGRLYGYRFTELAGVDLVSPDIRVFRVDKAGREVGIIYLDLYFRAGKQRGSWTTQYRVAQTRPGRRVVPITSVVSSVPAAPAGEITTVPLEIANVLFHEFGHALHMISSASPYVSTGSVRVAWDFIEVPSLFNERWLFDAELLARFALNAKTGQPMPPEMIERLRAAARFDRVFSVTLAYLGTALVDLKTHMIADGRTIDVAAEEARILREADMPPAIDLTLRALHSFHMFSESYAAGVYSYLWSDMIAADIAEAFTQAPDGPYARAVADLWFDQILSRGDRVPIEQAFREFRGREPDPGALMRKFGIGA
jgi:peptidyl-dipeptidase Dcp